VIVRGALQALISLGAGFSPQLSGIENIKNSAAMLGLTQTETRQVIGEVIEFSELSEFVDSPISSYSSGMYARLGFAVAVHLKPDLLFIDEILGVGDFAFQNKCFCKMNELQRKGVTVVLVSHSHGRITQMCEKAIWLKDGIIEAFGDSADTVKKYINHFDELENAKLVNEKMAKAENEAKSRFLVEGLFGGEFNGDGYVERIAVQVTSRDSEFTALNTHDPLEVDVDLKLISPAKRLKLGLVFYREDGERVAVNTSTEEQAINDFEKKHFHLRITYPNFCLRPGKYTLVVPIQDGQSFLYRLPVKKFLIRGAVDRTLGSVSVPVKFKEII
jgi:ABC-2 type transport system ATP-binding protein